MSHSRQGMTVCKPSKLLLNHKIEDVCLTLNWTSPCINPLPQLHPRANGAERRSRRKPGTRVLIPPGYLPSGEGKQ